MPPPEKPVMPKAAPPRFGAHFDAWNSSSSGHQRPENRPGTGWRESRGAKLNSQLCAGSSGGERLGDTWGAGSEDWDERLKVLVPQSLRERRDNSVVDMLMRPGKMLQSTGESRGPSPERLTEEALMEQRKKEDGEREASCVGRGIFAGVVVYVNGSTYPLVSDHKLKHLLAENGAKMSIHLARRQVTHVILGQPTGQGLGAGGGLAGGKIDKEIKKMRGCGVKFVGVEW